MATLTYSALDSLSHGAKSFGAWLNSVTETFYNANSLARDIEGVMALTDADLAAKGLSREQAVRSVAARYSYI